MSVGFTCPRIQPILEAEGEAVARRHMTAVCQEHDGPCRIQGDPRGKVRNTTSEPGELPGGAAPRITDIKERQRIESLVKRMKTQKENHK